MGKLGRWFRDPTQPLTPADPPSPPTREPDGPSDAEVSAALFPEEAAAAGEKRSAARQPLDRPATLLSASFASPEPVVVRNFTAYGMYFHAAFKPAMGQVVQITMKDPESGEPVRYEVRIIRTESIGPDQFGVAARITRRELLSPRP